MLDTYECVVSKLDVREFSSEKVPAEIKLKILEAGRLTGSGLNIQHWRFILVQHPENLKKLAQDSTTGKWVQRCNFAIILLTNPNYDFHMIDAGRALQDMQLVAWNFGVTACIFTGMRVDSLRKDFNIPEYLHPTVVVGFGYPAKKILGRKERLPLREIAFLEKYDNKMDHQRL